MCKPILLAMLAFVLPATSLAWAASNYDSSKLIVTALESSWDDKTQRPNQPAAEGFKIQEQVELKAGQSASGEMKIDFRAHYPQGSGNKQVDDLLKKYAEEKLSVFKNDAEEFLKGEQSQPGMKTLTFVAVKPSSKFISVVFFDSGYMGGDYGYQHYECKSYDLERGVELGPHDLFANPEDKEDTRPQQFFVNYVNAALDKSCFEEQTEASFCAPSGLTVDNFNENLNSVAFTPNGLAIIYGPYEPGPNAEGSKFVDVPKDDLFKWGFSEKFWK